MSSTLDPFRTDLRALLLDSAPPYQWPDAALDQALWEALAEYGTLFPRVTTLTLDVAPGQRAFTLLLATPVGEAVVQSADILGINRVALAARVLPVDPSQASDPAGTRPSHPGQAYRLADSGSGAAVLWLTNPPAGDEVGPGRLQVECSATVTRPAPDAPTIGWGGPATDRALLLLLAARLAYTTLAAWQARDGRPLPPGSAAAVPAAATLLDSQLTRALLARRSRAVRSRTLDL